jgi:G3E family GTPase
MSAVFDDDLFDGAYVSAPKTVPEGAKIIALAGTFGSGKSSTIAHLLQALELCGVMRDHVGVIMIDVGGVGEIYSTLSSQVRFEVLPNGCFTCGDPAVVRETIQCLEESGIRYVIFEGFGVISGDELAMALGQLKRPFDIIACIDGRQFAANVALGLGDLIQTHARVATVGVLVTKIDKVPQGTLESFLATHCGDVPWVASATPGFPKLWHERLLQRRPPTRFAATTALTMQASASGVHGWSTGAFLLHEGVTLEHVKTALALAVTDGRVRVKGVIAGQYFSAGLGQSDWDQVAQDGPDGICVVYLSPGTLESALGRFLSDLVSEKVERSYAVIRFAQGDSVEVTARLEDFVGQHGGAEPMVAELGAHVSLVTHPEDWQLMKELARRTATTKQWFFPVMQIFLQYWVRCGMWLASNTDRVETVALATYQRELGVSLAWWATHFREQLPDTLLEEIGQTKPALLVALGTEALGSLRVDDNFWRYWQALEYLRALTFGREHLSAEEEVVVVAAIERVFSLAPSPEEATIWRKWLADNPTM